MLTRIPNNTFNFIRWYRATGATVDDLPITTHDAIDLTAPYELTKTYQRAKRCFYPVLLKDFAHLIMINLDNMIDDANFPTYRVDLYQGGNEIQQGVGSLVKNSIDGSSYRMHFTGTIGAGVSNGYYQFVIVDTSPTDPAPDLVIYVSNFFEVISSDEVSQFMFLQFRNSTDIYAFDYTNVAGYNNVFLPINVIDEQPEIQLKQYRERSTGVLRNQKTQASKVLTLESDMFDEGAEDAMLALSVHDDIKINGVSVSVKEAFTSETIRETNLSKGRLTVYDERYSTINLNQ